jgi:hypothetical protein
MSDALQAAAELVRAVAPEIENIYLIDARDYSVPDVGFDVGGYTSYLMDLQLSRELAERGLWKGPGFCAAVYLDRVGTVQRFVNGAVLHEAGHWLAFPDRPVLDGDFAAVAAVADEICRFANDMDSQVTELRPPWHRHGADFVRACCHLIHRASKLDSEIAPWHGKFSSAYYGVDEVVWMRILQSELRDLEQLPIRAILQMAPSRDFAELHRLLTAWWQPAEEK